MPLTLLVAVFLLIPAAGSASAAAPTIVSTSAAAVTTKTAVLQAKVNPGGEATTYNFEYGTADCSANPCAGIPVPNGNVGAGSGVIEVSNEIAALSPGTTYHFRVLATNGSGTVAGPDTVFHTFAADAPDAKCPNQAFRYGPGAFLPDCRAYEMVSPVEKGGRSIRQFAAIRSIRAGYNQSDLNGEKFTYASSASFGDQVSSRNANQYIATRGAGGWTTHGINPLAGRSVGEPFFSFTGDFETPFKVFSPDLSNAWLMDMTVARLTPDAAEGGWPNLYRRDNLTDGYEALTTSVLSNPAEIEVFSKLEEFLEVQGHSRDFSHVLFTDKVALTPNAVVGTQKQQVYDFSGGEVHLVSVLPDGTANAGVSTVGTVQLPIEHNAWFSHAVSDDGSRVFWTNSTGGSPGSPGQGKIYVRKNPGQPQSALNGASECTEPAKACTIPVSSGTAQFWTASADGSEAIYSEGPLRDAENERGTLYRRDVDAETSTQIAKNVTGVLGAGDDASYVYFTSWEVLDGGAAAGEPNLYLEHEGSITFVATLTAADTGPTEGPNGIDHASTVDSTESRYHSSRVTPDGRHLAFQTAYPQLGYDNTDAVNGKAALEVYLYDADADELTCASCNPSGGRPVGQVLQAPYDAGAHVPTFGWAAAWIPTFSHDLYAPRALSSDGNRLYFNSFDALVPRDSNGAQDVYQWEAQGTGGCERAGGCINLLSTGEDPQKSEFVDATPDGSDVFIETDSDLDPRDPGLTDIYDVREGGGYPPSPPPSPPCVGDACQSIPAAPNDPTPASAGFRGAGDPAPRRNCSAQTRRAAELGRQAKRLARAARRSSEPGQAKQLRKRSARLAKQAEQLDKGAGRCRRANRGAGR
jgi:hypothetical protein